MRISYLLDGMMNIMINDYAPVQYSYIDPGTGSMLFTILIGTISVMIYSLKGLWIKLRYAFNKDAKRINTNAFPYAIYSDDKRYWTTFKPICDLFEERKQAVLYLTQSKDDPVFQQNYEFIKAEFIGEGNKGFTRLNFLDADIVLSTTPGLDVYQWKRSRNVKHYIHVLHAPSDVTLYKMFGLDYYDAVIVSGKYQELQIRQLERMRNIAKKDIRIFGLPYLDELKKRKDNVVLKNSHKKTVIIAPSWGPNSLLNKFGEKLIDSLLNSEYHIILRPHPQSYKSETDLIKRFMDRYPDHGKIEWNNDLDNFEVLNKSDILISDFSGVMFDFALIFNRPVIYTDTDFDTSPYDASWLDEPLWTFEVLPKIGKKISEENVDKINELVDSTINDPDIKTQINLIRNVTWSNIGESAELIVNYMMNKEKDIGD